MSHSALAPESLRDESPLTAPESLRDAYGARATEWRVAEGARATEWRVTVSVNIAINKCQILA